MATKYETLAIKFAPELYYKKPRNPFQNITPKDMGGLYWHLVKNPQDKTEVCIQYIAFFKQQRWVPSVFDKFSGKLPGEHPNDYVPIFLYFKGETPVRAVFDVCHYEAVGEIDAPSPMFPQDERPQFHVRNFYRGVLPLEDSKGYSLLKAVPTPLSRDLLAHWWKGLTSSGSYNEKAKLIIKKKLESPFQEMKTFRDRAGKLGFIFDLLYKSAEDVKVKGPQDASTMASRVERQLGNKKKDFSHRDIVDIIEQSGVPEYLALRGSRKFQRI
ncbi:MAG: hypothetical protein HXS48_23380 [Theionarchaea archaeon]|nr:hypothetical protein [Theionarchaea archaeon]